MNRIYPWLPETVERDGVLKIDWTGYQNIEACKRKAAIAISLKRELAVDDWALVAGRAVHEALDERQQAIMRGETENLLGCMEEALERFFEGLQVPPDEYRTLGRLKEVVGVYQQTFEDEPFEVLESEQAREKELGEVWYPRAVQGESGCYEQVKATVVWQGKLDGLWRNPDTGELCVKDTKTSSRDEFATSEGSEFSKGEAKYQMSGQFKGYCWLMSGQGRLVTGAVLDQVVIRKPVARVTSKTPPQNECKRRFFSWTPGQLEEWRRETLYKIGEWLTACAQAGNVPPSKNETNCAWPTVCAYFSSCVQTTEEERMRRLAGPRFRDRTWDPMTAGKETVRAAAARSTVRRYDETITAEMLDRALE